MKTIERKKIGESKLYRINTGHSDDVTVCVPSRYGRKPLPSIWVGRYAPLLTVSRANFAAVLRAHRSGKAVA